jgi:serine/threonine-protein kinase 24/25/MST4
VYKAIEKSTGEIVAIKHVRFHCPIGDSVRQTLTTLLQVDLESSEEDISDIQAEIAVLSSCASPYVTQYKTAFLRGQKLWIVMEYLGGGSCQDLV